MYCLIQLPIMVTSSVVLLVFDFGQKNSAQLSSQQISATPTGRCKVDQRPVSNVAWPSLLRARVRPTATPPDVGVAFNALTGSSITRQSCARQDPLSELL